MARVHQRPTTSPSYTFGTGVAPEAPVASPDLEQRPEPSGGNQLQPEPTQPAQSQPEPQPQPQPSVVRPTEAVSSPQQERDERKEEPARQQREPMPAAMLDKGLEPKAEPARQWAIGGSANGETEAEASANDPNLYDVSFAAQPEAPAAPEPVATRAPSSEQVASEVAEDAKEEEPPRKSRVLERVKRAFSVTSSSREEMAKGRTEETSPPPTNNAPVRRQVPDVLTEDLPDHRFFAAIEDMKKKAKETIKDRSYTGKAVSDKLMGSRRLNMDEVSIGTESIREILRSPSNRFLETIEEATGIHIDASKQDVVETVADVLNNQAVRMKVVASKSPINKGSSAQVRILRVHVGRGIMVHPTQAKAYNADFDGDEMVVTFDQKRIDRFNQAMTYLVDIDGKCTIDPDFFHIPQLTGKTISREDAMDYIRDVVLGGVSCDKELIGNALIDLSENGTDENWASLMYALYDGTSNLVLVSNALKAIYDNMRELRLVKAEFEMAGDETLAFEVPRIEPADMAIQVALDEMHAGQPPMNFQEFKVLMSQYIGEVDPDENGVGKNVQFRIGANIAKLVRMDERLIVGEAGLFELYERTMVAGVAKQISGVINMGTVEHYVGDIMRRHVLAKVGFPGDAVYEESMSKFIDAFIREYRIIERMMAIANVQFLSDMSIQDGEQIITEIENFRLKSLITPLLNVYGDFTIGKMFSSSAHFSKDSQRRGIWGSSNKAPWIDNRLMEKTLLDLSRDNRIEVSIKEATRYGDMVFGRIDDGTLTSALIRLIADKKSSTASAYNKLLIGDPHKHKEGMLKKMHDLVRAINAQVSAPNRPRDWASWVNDMTELIYITGPEVFSYFNMDSPKTFMLSRYGREILSTRDSDHLGGVMISMKFEYRMSRIEKARKRIDDMMARYEAEGKEPDVAAIEHAAQLYEAEIDALASSSMAWSSIVKEQQTGEAWDMLSKSKGSFGTRVNVKLAYAAEYWANPWHDDVTSFMTDPSVGKEMKEAVMADLCRWHEHYAAAHAYEMTYQLDLKPAAVYETMGYEAKSSPFKGLKAANDRIDGYKKKSFKAASENIQQAYEKYGDKKGRLDSMLKVLASNPNALIELDDSILADAISANLDKEYGQSEKSRQTYAANRMYYGLSYQINGGMYTDVDRTDGFAVGITREDQLSIKDIVRILADPEYKLMVARADGSVTPLDCETMCGGTTEDDKWSFLLSHPRASLALRPHKVSALNDEKKRCYLTATGSTSSLLKNYEHLGDGNDGWAKSILWNHPMYGAMVALLGTAEGHSSRKLRMSYVEAERALRGELMHAAYRANQGDMVSSSSIVDDVLRLTIDAIKETGCKEDIAESLHAELVEKVGDYVEQLGKAGVVSSKPPLRDSRFALTLPSVAMYYDTKQDLSGAKTMISTGVEGQETWNLAPWISLLATKDKYDLIGSATEETLIEQLGNCMTSLGVTVSEVDFDAIGDEDVVVEVPDWYAVQDKMLDKHGRQVSSVARYLVVKRDDGAEKFNLKVKKFGDDGKDSITKYIKDDVMSDNDEVTTDIRTAYEKSGLFAAKMQLAQRLKDINYSYDYKDMDIANYMCLADLMVKEVTDEETGEPTVIVRSIAQIAYAIRNQISMEMVSQSSVDELKEEAQRIADETGIAMSYDIESLIGSVKVAGRASRGRVSLRSRSSSFDRNATVVRAAMKRNPSLVPMSDAAVRLHSRRRLNEDEKLDKVVSGMWGYSFLGTIGKDTVENIGPRNVWYLPKNLDENLVEAALDRAESLCITVIMDSPSSLVGRTSKFANDLVPVPGSKGMWMLPFFDMELNGSEADPWTGKPAVWVGDPSQVVRTYEDDLNEFSVGDSGFEVFEDFTDRITPSWEGTYEAMASELFADTIAHYRKLDEYATFSYSLAREEDVRKLVVNEFPEDVAIDYGVTAKSQSFDEVKRIVDERIEEYRLNYVGTDENGWLANARPDMVVGWMQCDVQYGANRIETVYAPVIPWMLGTKGRSPQEYRIKDYQFSIGSRTSDQSLTFDWEYTGSLESGYAKFHEGAGAANKFVAYLKAMVRRRLQNGTPLDGCYATESTASRRLGSNKRIATLVTLMFTARDNDHGFGYNFAETDGAFRSNPELRERLRHERIPMTEWRDSIIPNGDPSNIEWHTDKEINAFLVNQIGLCLQFDINPSDFLASKFDGHPTNVFWEWEALFDTGWGYQNSLLKFFNMMMPSLCPPDLSGDGTGTFFRVCHEKDWDFGCMQVRIPHESARDGSTFYTWGNMYAGWSFFGSDCSAWSKPSINGSSEALDALNTMSLMGKQPAGYNFRELMRWAKSDRPLYDQPGSISLDMERWIKEMTSGTRE